MTCSDVGLELTRAARKPESDLSDEVRRHLEACEHCRKVWEFLVGSSEPDPLLTSNTRKSLEPSRNLSSRLRPFPVRAF